MPCKFSQHVKCVATIVANWEWETKSEVRTFLNPQAQGSARDRDRVPENFHSPGPSPGIPKALLT